MGPEWDGNGVGMGQDVGQEWVRDNLYSNLPDCKSTGLPEPVLSC